MISIILVPLPATSITAFIILIEYGMDISILAFLDKGKICMG